MKKLTTSSFVFSLIIGAMCLDGALGSDHCFKDYQIIASLGVFVLWILYDKFRGIIYNSEKLPTGSKQ